MRLILNLSRGLQKFSQAEPFLIDWGFGKTTAEFCAALESHVLSLRGKEGGLGKAGEDKKEPPVHIAGWNEMGSSVPLPWRIPIQLTK